ncbi:MAG: ion channel, partial [Gammaproteobacteria bacterium]
AYYAAGLGIASRSSGGIGVGDLFSRLFSLRFLRALAALAGVLFVIGCLVWIFERRRNTEQFGGGAGRGLGNGFWWAAVTMTTVGYGDKTPVTLGGRIVALVWMFASIIFISGFTGALASAFTIEELGSQIRGSADLPHVRVGTRQSSAAAQYLTDNRIRFESFVSNEGGLQALADDRLDAFVGDQPILQYWVNLRHHSTLTVLPRTLDQGYLAFGVPTNSPLLKDLDVALLSAVQSPGWGDLVHKYLGIRFD